jgi:hypothetical protein
LAAATKQRALHFPTYYSWITGFYEKVIKVKADVTAVLD